MIRNMTSAAGLRALFSRYEPVTAARNITERNLLLAAGFFVLVNLLSLALQRPQLSLSIGLYGLSWMVCAAGSHLFLNRALPDRNPFLLPLALFCSGWGILLIGRLLPDFGLRQSLWLFLSVIVMLAVARLPRLLLWLKRYRYTWLVLGLLLLVSTIAFGVNPSGAGPRLWLGVGDVYFQPSEILKIVLIAFLASYLSENAALLLAARESSVAPRRTHWLTDWRFYSPIVIMWGISMLVLVWQRDLGTAAVFFLAFLLLLYASSGSSLLIVVGLALMGVAGMIAYRLFDLVALRIDIWIDPWRDASGSAYQIVQSLMAVAEGGVFGQGIGQGAPGSLPLAHSDLVFSVLAEEFGLIGVVVLCLALVSFVAQGFIVALRRPQRLFESLLAVGLTLILCVQGLLIIGGVLKLIPLTGVTLPFVSYGGSSLLVSYIIVGILLNISNEA